MKENNKLVRSKVPALLKEKGYNLKTIKLKGEEFKIKLHSLFLHEYKECIGGDDPNFLQVHYADMLEVIRTLMVFNGINTRELQEATYQPVEWYDNFASKKVQVKSCRTDLLQKFYELLLIESSEIVKDQLRELFTSFKKLMKATELEFAQIEIVRRDMLERLGGFNGVYLEKVSKVVE